MPQVSLRQRSFSYLLGTKYGHCKGNANANLSFRYLCKTHRYSAFRMLALSSFAGCLNPINRRAAKGHGLTVYLRSRDRLLCEVKRSPDSLPGVRRRTAICGRSRTEDSLVFGSSIVIDLNLAAACPVAIASYLGSRLTDLSLNMSPSQPAYLHDHPRSRS